MAKRVFINLPVKDLQKSIDFFAKLGYAFNSQFTDETATCMIVSEEVAVMLLTEAKFKTFTPNAVCDARRSTEVLICIAVDSREQVRDLVRRAVAAGGNLYKEPEDFEFMYTHGFQDLDGHIWEVVYMEPDVLGEGEPQI